MRTSYNKENNQNKADSKILSNMENAQISDDSDRLSEEEIKELNISEETKVFSKEELTEDNESYDNIFSDGKYEVITPDFYKISQEVEDALNLENISVLEESFENEELDLDEEIDLNCSTDEVEDNQEDDIKSTSLEKDEDYSEVKRTILNKKVVVGSVIVLVALGVSVGYGLLNNNSNDLKDLESQVDRLYTTSRKEDLKNSVDSDKISKYYDKLDGIKDSEDKSELKEELDTISYYLSDKVILENINDSSYDLNSNSLLTDIDKIKQSSMGYSIPSLSSSISSLIKQIESDYNYYIGLRDELSLVKDSTNFDLKGYQLKVNKVSHTPNKQELQSILNTISKDMKLSETVEDIKNTTSEKVNEAVLEVKDDLGSKIDDFIDSAKSFFSSILEGFKGIFSNNEPVEN